MEQIYYHMWEEEQFSYSKFDVDIDSYKKTANNQLVVKWIGKIKRKENKWKNNRWRIYRIET